MAILEVRIHRTPGDRSKQTKRYAVAVLELPVTLPATSFVTGDHDDAMDAAVPCPTADDVLDCVRKKLLERLGGADQASLVIFGRHGPFDTVAEVVDALMAHRSEWE